MTFSHPWVLALLAIPVLLGWSVISRAAGVTLPFDHVRHADRRWTRRALGVFDAVPLLALATAIVILAGPQTLQQPRSERLLTNIQICMDVSGSMAGRNYQIASEAIESFTHAREGDAFGLTIFGVQQVRWLPLTKDLQAVRNAMPFANPENQPPHMMGTMIGAALRFCMHNMKAEGAEGDRMIILVSDGVSFDLRDGEEYDIADELLAAGITVYHIHVDESSVPPEVAELAKLTGGDSFHATDSQNLKAIFAHIDRMRPARFAQVGAVPMDHFRPFTIAALGLFAMHLAGLAGLRYTPW